MVEHAGPAAHKALKLARMPRRIARLLSARRSDPESTSERAEPLLQNRIALDEVRFVDERRERRPMRLLARERLHSRERRSAQARICEFQVRAQLGERNGCDTRVGLNRIEVWVALLARRNRLTTESRVRR